MNKTVEQTKQEIVEEFEKNFIISKSPKFGNPYKPKNVETIWCIDMEQGKEIIIFLHSALDRIVAVKEEEIAKDCIEIIDDQIKPENVAIAFHIGWGALSFKATEAIAKKYKVWEKYKSLSHSEGKGENI